MTDKAARLRALSDAIIDETENLEAVERDVQSASAGDPRLEVATETAHAGAESLTEDTAEARRLAQELGE